MGAVERTPSWGRREGGTYSDTLFQVTHMTHWCSPQFLPGTEEIHFAQHASIVNYATVCPSV